MSARRWIAATHRSLWAGCMLAGLTGCAMVSNEGQPKPKEIGSIVAQVPVRQVWAAKLGATAAAPLVPHVYADTVTLASPEGVVLALNSQSGAALWRVQVAEGLSAGVGSDGQFTAVVSRNNEVIVFEAGREKWRQRLSAPAYTAPLLAGGRLFVIAADRTISAFDVALGRRLWVQQRTGEPLVLRHASVMLPVGNTLVLGVSGKLLGLNPDTGAVRWEAPVSIPRGTNDVERLVDLVGQASRSNDSVCVRAFQSVVGCVDAGRGLVSWTQKSSGADGIAGDEDKIYGVESTGIVSAWGRANGQRGWSSDVLQHRKLTAPLRLGRSVVVGDETGAVYWLSREDGSLLNRITTDGSGIAAAPVVAAETLVVLTRAGNVYGFRPD